MAIFVENNLNFMIQLQFYMLMLILGVLFIWMGVKAKKDNVKMTLFLLASIPIALFAFELIMKYKVYKAYPPITTESNFYDNPNAFGPKSGVGYGPSVDTTLTYYTLKHIKKELIYSTKYKIDQGERVIPNNNLKSNQAIYFLGGSYLFGDGLADDETLPVQLNKVSNEAYRLKNMAFSGYGTHQALWLLENEIALEKDTLNKTILYYFIPNHIERCAGNSPWETNGPHYEVVNDELVFQGGYDEQGSPAWKAVKNYVIRIWGSSHLHAGFKNKNFVDKDLIRTREILLKMNQICKANGYRFVTILSKNTKPGNLEPLFYKPLEKSNLEYYYIDQILEIDSTNSQGFYIKGDSHPNLLHNQKLATFIHSLL